MSKLGRNGSKRGSVTLRAEGQCRRLCDHTYLCCLSVPVRYIDNKPLAFTVCLEERVQTTRCGMS